MKVNELAKAVANTLVNTGVEGGFDAVSCSTAGDYPSIGCSQWEGGRADSLLSYIDGGDYFLKDFVVNIPWKDLIDELIDFEYDENLPYKIIKNALNGRFILLFCNNF